MPTYSTPNPISVLIRVVSGDIRLMASDRADTVVKVTPSQPSSDEDVSAAELTRVEFIDGTVKVTGAKGRGLGLMQRPGSIQLAIELPTGSHVEAVSGLGVILGAGQLGECRLRTGAGDIRLGRVATIDASTGLGGIVAERITGDATCSTASGSVRLAAIGGSARIKNSNGDTWIGETDADLRANASNGTICVDRARGDVRAATANGDLRIGSTEGGVVELKTALGRIDVGIKDGIAARLDLHTSFGTVLNELAAVDRPAAGESTVDVSAQTSAGDIVIRRA